jgi:ABC-type sugar transport system ATPase subunit
VTKLKEIEVTMGAAKMDDSSNTSALRNPGDDDRPVLFEAADVSKNFEATRALDHVTVQFQRHDVHAIVGENGAGKSTLVKVISGVYGSNTHEGELRLEGRKLSIHNIAEAEANGIFLVPQDLQVVAELSVAENIFLNREPHRLGVVDWKKMLADAKKLMDDFRIDCSPTDAMGHLSTAKQKLVIITRAMARGVRVLALDEPTAALTETETQILFDYVLELKNRGISIIYISHRLDEITNIADRITVLRDGRVVDHLERGDPIAVTQRVVRAMVGRNVKLQSRKGYERGKAKLEVQDLSLEPLNRGGRPQLSSITLSVHSGEIVGVFGSVGSGTDALVGSLLGMTNVRPTGTISVDGKTVSLRSPSDAIKAGVGYLPADRGRDAIFPVLSVAQHITLLMLSIVSTGGVLRPRGEAALAKSYIDQFSIKISSSDDLIGQLSGGNQQKVVIARLLASDPKIFIFHDPTQGVDIATKKEVYDVIDDLAKAGKAVMVVSSDLEEIFLTADRIVVLRAGALMGHYRSAETTEEEVLSVATADTLRDIGHN